MNKPAQFDAELQRLETPEGNQFFKFLDRISFELSDWHFIHLDEVGVIASYHVSAPSLSWKAYVTSVWAKRGGLWQTVFYQASNAKLKKPS